jgi:hypothetical protein
MFTGQLGSGNSRLGNVILAYGAGRRVVAGLVEIARWVVVAPMTLALHLRDRIRTLLIDERSASWGISERTSVISVNPRRHSHG